MTKFLIVGFACLLAARTEAADLSPFDVRLTNVEQELKQLKAEVEQLKAPKLAVGSGRKDYDPYHVEYAELYRNVKAGWTGLKLVVGPTDPYIGTYQTHAQVPSGFGGLADGVYSAFLDRAGGPTLWQMGTYRDDTPMPVGQNRPPTLVTGTGHTHTCKTCGTTWDHGANPSHNCPNCGRAEYVQDTGVAFTGNRPVQVKENRAARRSDKAWMTVLEGGCANGSCPYSR